MQVCFIIICELKEQCQFFEIVSIFFRSDLCVSQSMLCGRRIIILDLIQILKIISRRDLACSQDHAQKSLEIPGILRKHSFIIFLGSFKLQSLESRFGLFGKFFSMKLNYIELITTERTFKQCQTLIKSQDTCAF